SKESRSKFPNNSCSSERGMPRILSIHSLNGIRSKVQTSASANCSGAIGSRLAALCANCGSWLNCRSIGDLIFTAFLTLLRHVSSVAASVLRVQKRHERRANAAKLCQIETFEILKLNAKRHRITVILLRNLTELRQSQHAVQSNSKCKGFYKVISVEENTFLRRI
uniref:Uncharacterized protein n=1 Tax=Parascaris univalens TaxID=6257 RepID=A0A915BVZ0_PARUN